MVLFTFFLVLLKQILAEDTLPRVDYYSMKFDELKTKITDGYIDDDGAKKQSLQGLLEEVLNTSNSKIENDYQYYSQTFTKLVSIRNECSGDFQKLSIEYNGWKNENIDPFDEKENAKKNKDKFATQIRDIDKKQETVRTMLEDCKANEDKVFSILSEISVNMSKTSRISQVLDLVANFCALGGSVWIILGTITLAGSLKDKNGPTLQTSIWQIVGGTMIVFTTYLFRNISQYPNLLNEVLRLASQFTRVGGALWAAWGVIILAGAIKDKTGPALQSAIWQIVGGIMIIVTSYLFTSIVKTV